MSSKLRCWTKLQFKHVLYKLVFNCPLGFDCKCPSYFDFKNFFTFRFKMSLHCFIKQPLSSDFTMLFLFRFVNVLYISFFDAHSIGKLKVSPCSVRVTLALIIYTSVYTFVFICLFIDIMTGSSTGKYTTGHSNTFWSTHPIGRRLCPVFDSSI